MIITVTSLVSLLTGATPCTFTCVAVKLSVKSHFRSCSQSSCWNLLLVLVYLCRGVLCTCSGLCYYLDVAVLRDMNTDYQQCLASCKQLSQHSSQFDPSSQSTLSAMSLTTDRLLYSCAIEMVCS